MLESLEDKKKRYTELEKLLSDPETLKNRSAYQGYAKEMASLAPILKKYDEYLKAEDELKNIESLLKGKHDREFIDLARAETEELKASLQSLKSEIEEMLVEEDPDADRNIIMEIRAGTGGLARASGRRGRKSRQ